MTQVRRFCLPPLLATSFATPGMNLICQEDVVVFLALNQFVGYHLHPASLEE